ncbi:MAG: hypothetical protein QM776_08340 [Rhodocyclaceae bacterium]
MEAAQPVFGGLTALGIIHTAISLVAVFAGIVALCRDGQIHSRNTLGRIYLITTVLTCLTGFGIFQHGGFGNAHVLGIVTLLVLGAALLAEYKALFGRHSAAVRVVSYSLSFTFHWIPAITETTTRLPLGAPLLASPEVPELKAVAGVLLLLFVMGAALQLRRLKQQGDH